MSKVELLVSEILNQTETSLSLKSIMSYFLAAKKSRIREETYIYYSRNLEDIINFFESIGIISSEQLNDMILNMYICHSRDIKHHKNNTINKRLETLRMALRYCEKRKFISINPMKDFENLPKDDVETKTIPLHIMKQIITYVDQLPRDNISNLRNKLMIYLLIDTAVRLKELRYIELKNINIEEGTIYLTQTKTRNHRTVYFHEKTKLALMDYLNSTKITQYIMVVPGTNTILNPTTMSDFLDKIKRKLDIPNEVSISFHKFRHTCATMLLESGANIVYIQRLLGHTELSQTQKYVHLSKKVNIEQHKQHSPLNFV